MWFTVVALCDGTLLCSRNQPFDPYRASLSQFIYLKEPFHNMSVMCCSNGLALWMEFSVDNTLRIRKLLSIFFTWDFWKHKFFTFWWIFPRPIRALSLCFRILCKPPWCDTCNDFFSSCAMESILYKAAFNSKGLSLQYNIFFNFWPLKYLHVVKKKRLYLMNQKIWNNDISSMVWDIKQRYFITS